MLDVDADVDGCGCLHATPGLFDKLQPRDKAER